MNYSPLQSIWKSIVGTIEVFVVIALPVMADSIIPEIVDELYRSPSKATVYVAIAVGILRGLRNWIKNRNK